MTQRPEDLKTLTGQMLVIVLFGGIGVIALWFGIKNLCQLVLGARPDMFSLVIMPIWFGGMSIASLFNSSRRLPDGPNT